MPRLLIKRIFLLLTAHCLLLTAVLAQSSTATLSGTIEDENGALIPGAAIAVVNEATSFKRTATTNDSGSFSIPLLPPGEYTVLVEREGFTRVQLTNIVLNVGDQKAVQVQLKVGDVASTVEVRSDASLLRTDGSVGTVVDQQFVRNIPLNGRSFHSLLTLTPGVVLTSSNTIDGQFSVNGQRKNSNYFTVDGVDANTGSAQGGTTPGIGASGQLPGMTASGTTASLVAVDALQEFRIQTSTYAPEYGRTPGGQVQLVTKSGTNDFHGSVFEYIRNEAFEANDWFANRNGLKRPPTRQHQFGGTIGGPLYLPRFGDGGPGWYSGKDRTHFFFSYEGLRLQLPKFFETSVPTLCFRGDAPCEGGRQPAHVEYRPILRAFPIPNGAEVFANCTPTDPDPLCTTTSPGVRIKPSGFARVAMAYSDSSRYDAVSIRLDHRFGEKFSVFGRYNLTPSKSFTRNVAHDIHTFVDISGLTVGSTWVVSKGIVNDLRFNRSLTDSNGGQDIGGFGGSVPPNAFGFLGRSPETGQFIFSVSGLPAPTTSLSFFWGTNSDYLQRQFNIVDNLLVSSGNHQLKFGVDFRRSNPLLVTGLAGGETLLATFAQLSTGQIQSYIPNAYDSQRHAPVFDNLSLYAQDTWRLTRRLTVTYGVRWEFVPPPHAAEGPEAITVDGLETPTAPNSLRIAPSGAPLWQKRYNNFAPRVGASYLLVERPSRELVVRGGWGIFYDLGLGNSAQHYGQIWPNVASVTYPITGTGSPCPAPITLPMPACARIIPAPGSTPPNLLNIIARDIVLPRVYQWNLSVEQSLGAGQSLTVSYVGSSAKKLLSTSRYVGLRLQGFTYPGTSTTALNLQRNDGYSDYNALQMQFQRRLNNGLQVIAAYTFSSAKDTESSDIFGLPIESVPTSYTYGSADFDVRHNFNAAVTYEIPGLKLGNLIYELTRDWGIDSRFSIRSGFPLSPQVAVTLPGISTSFIRANVVPGQPFWIDDSSVPGGKYLNLAAFSMPDPGTLGNLPRGAVRGFGAWQLDLSLRREFPLFEKVRLQLRADVFNVTNTPTFADPGPTFNASTLHANYGRAGSMLNKSIIGSSALNAIYQVGGPRSMQFSARIMF